MSLMEYLQKIDANDVNTFIKEASIYIDLFQELHIKQDAFENLTLLDDIHLVIDSFIIYTVKHFPAILVVIYNIYNVYKVTNLFYKKWKDKKTAQTMLAKLSKFSKDKKEK